jgi:hypothetical protein
MGEESCTLAQVGKLFAPGTRWDFRCYAIPAASSALFKWMQ